MSHLLAWLKIAGKIKTQAVIQGNIVHSYHIASGKTDWDKYKASMFAARGHGHI